MTNRFGPLPKTLVSLDSLAGFVTALATYPLVYLSKPVRDQGITILLVQGALGMAILAVVLTALSILVAFMGDEYLVVLDHAPEGVEGAMLPYKAVAGVSCVLTLESLASAVVLPLLPVWAAALVLAIASDLAVWAVIGTGQLVFITAFHGEQRARLLKAMRDARRELQKRRNSA